MNIHLIKESKHAKSLAHLVIFSTASCLSLCSAFVFLRGRIACDPFGVNKLITVAYWNLSNQLLSCTKFRTLFLE